METAEKELHAKINETAAAPAEQAEILPKGNTIEQQANVGAEQQPKRGRGRPKGSKDKPKEETEQEAVKQPDAITPMINGLVIPQVAKYYNKEAADCMFSKEQSEMLAQMQPPNSGIQPSWFWYSVTCIALLLGNVMAAKEIKKEEEKQPEPMRIETRQHPNEVQNVQQ